jgi:hypothetical protein
MSIPYWPGDVMNGGGGVGPTGPTGSTGPTGPAGPAGGVGSWQVVSFNSTNFPPPNYNQLIGPTVPVAMTNGFSLTQGHTYTVTMTGVKSNVFDSGNGNGFSVYVLEGFSAAPPLIVHNMGYIPYGSSGPVFSFTTTFTAQSSSVGDTYVMILNNSTTTNQTATLAIGQCQCFVQDWGIVP